GDADAVERGGQARDRQLVPGDLDGCGLEEETVAQGGRAEGARRRGEEVAAGEGGHGGGKLHPLTRRGASKLAARHLPVNGLRQAASAAEQERDDADACAEHPERGGSPEGEH